MFKPLGYDVTQPDPNDLPPPVADFLPTTFLERGIAVPFTTPILAGTRARPGERVPMELIVPSPSGGRGVYILPWQDISALCRPTLHDARLTATIAGVQGVTPRTIRKAARETAALGFAGRAAAAAAAAAEAAERTASLTVNFELLLALVRRVEPPGECAIPPEQEQEQPAELERRARRATARIAPEFGRTPEAIATTLEQLADVYSCIGIGRTANTCRVPQLLARLIRLRADLGAYLLSNVGDSARDAALVASALDLTITCARVAITDSRHMSTDVTLLIRKWILQPEAVAQSVARADWLLDGWDRIAALWDTAQTPSDQQLVLSEMCSLVPSVPREVGSWVGHHLNMEADSKRHRRKVVLMQDWRTGRSVVDVADLIGRNESLIEQTV